MTVVAGGRLDDAAWIAAAHALPREQRRHEFVVSARTLSSVLDEAGAAQVDFLSLDVEGYEPIVLRGIDFNRHSPQFLLIEARDEAAREAIEAVIGSYYLLDRLSPFDLLYARSD